MGGTRARLKRRKLGHQRQLSPPEREGNMTVLHGADRLHQQIATHEKLMKFCPMNRAQAFHCICPGVEAGEISIRNLDHDSTMSPQNSPEIEIFFI
ncbi:hypothetical protein NPIL_466001 [Nephila pilipes]|uniref:Uncharacterized protein n=1 Tax=Nephila pilipes TaxID=299642 RepID=A0A8X6PMZ6_NEPPI|nr:hypothetical protein NPIL_466001 [Nephila pilipes]